MKVETESRFIEVSGSLANRSMSYEIDFEDEDNQAIFFDLLRSKIYNDPVSVVVRETASNCLDAHTQADIKDRPFKIQAPSALDPTLSFRDYGYGLDPMQMVEIYTKYLKTTKNKSNDYIGCRGLGCKSPFSYTESFNIISITKHPKDPNTNIRVEYIAYIDESRKGALSPISESLTDEETGLEVRISVRRNDINRFQEEIRKFCCLLPVKPICNIEIPIRGSRLLDSGEYWDLYADDGLDPFQNRVVLLVGPIPYVLNELSSSFPEIADLFNCRLVVKCNIGDVSIPYGRESIHYDEKTTRYLGTLLKAVKEDMANRLIKSVEALPNLDSAIMFWEGLSYSLRRALFKSSSVMWQGIDIRSNPQIDAHSNFTGQRIYPERRTLDRWSRISYRQGLLFVYNDINLATAPTKPIVEWIKENYTCSEMYFVQALPDKGWYDISKEKLIQYTKWINYSDLKEEYNLYKEREKEAARIARASLPKVARVKNQISVSIVETTGKNLYCSNPYKIPSQKIDVELIDQSIPYVLIVGFNNSSSALEEGLSLLEIRKMLDTLNLQKAYLFSKADIAKIPSGMIKLSEALRRYAEAEISKDWQMTIDEFNNRRSLLQVSLLTNKLEDLDENERSVVSVINSPRLQCLLKYLKDIGEKISFCNSDLEQKTKDLERMNKYITSKRICNVVASPDRTTDESFTEKVIETVKLLTTKYSFVTDIVKDCWSYKVVLEEKDDGSMEIRKEARDYIKYIYENS